MQEIVIEREQEELLFTLVEASRNVPREERQKFIVMRIDNAHQDILHHEGLPGRRIMIYFGDVEILARKGLVSLTFGPSGSPLFEVTPEGFRHYERLRKKAEQPVAHVEAGVRSFLDGSRMASEYPDAYRAWAEAEATLWGTDAKEKFTAIGHSCREALQHFCTVLIAKYAPPGADSDPSRTVSRLKALVAARRAGLPSALPDFLDALIAYWGAVSDLAQRQEHGAQKEGEPLRWEDARRVVFQTAILMYEVDRALSGS
jgi:hypothetical protein